MPADKHSGELQIIAAEWFAFFDTQFEKMSVDIPDRPMFAASWFVEHAIAEVPGHVKEEYLTSEWFPSILKLATKWYEPRYGEALRGDAGNIVGVIEALGGYFKIAVPETIARPNDEKTYWLIFPTQLEPEDKPEQWICRPPNLPNIDSDKRDQILERVTVTGCCLRRICQSVGWSAQKDALSRELARASMSHLALAAQCISEHKNTPIGLACWEAHQSVEKAMKLLARQNGVDYPRTHDLCHLRDAIETLVRELDMSALASLPQQSRLIQIRMGEGDRVIVNDAYDMYQAALKIVEEIGKAMPREPLVEGGKFLLRRMPWQK